MSRPEYINSFVGFPSFFKTPIIDVEGIKEGMAVVAGVPIDMGIVLARPGTRYGPKAIRESSNLYRGFSEVAIEKTVVNIDTKVAWRLKEHPNVADIGDFTIYPQDIMETGASITEGVYEIAKRGALPVVLGGDHYITYPAFEGFAKAMAERKSNPRLGHVHIDSHPDFRDRYENFGRYNHGTCVRRLSENSMVSYKNLAWVGLNGNVLDADIYRIYRSQRLKMFSAQDVREQGIGEIIKEAVETAADGTDAIYVSIDIDVVDGSQSPGTGAPVFEGIDARDLLRAMEQLSTYDIIGAFDLCEVSPPLDPGERTAHLAANGLIGFLAPRLFDTVNLDS